MSTMSGSPLRALPLLAVTTALCLLSLAPAKAQTMTNTFGGFSKNSNQPIDIESDVLVVHDAQKYATFKGNVKAVQGTTTLQATELDVHYVGSGSDSLTKGTDATGSTPAAEGQSGGVGVGGQKGTQISKIEARGEVVITSDQDQTTKSDWALYDVPAQLVTVGGNVVLMQGQNVLKGDRLVIDLKTGESRFENTGNAAAGGRIRALFVPKGAKNGKPGDAKPDETESGATAEDATASTPNAPSAETPADDVDVPWPPLDSRLRP